jgi:hypothetical protein
MIRGMVAFRSHRLERLLGGRIDEVDHAAIAALVAAEVPEAVDLDFKRDLYGGSDADKRALAGDVAALANAVGGLLVLGIDDGKQDRAVAAPGVAVSDAEINRVRQIVAANAAPAPEIDPHYIEDPENRGHGFLLIGVPRSLRAPHAVIVNRETLRFPKRIGTMIAYLGEAELAEAYRARFTGLQSRVEEAADAEHALIDWIRPGNNALTWVVVTLAPDTPGDFAIDTTTFKEFNASAVSTSPLIVSKGLAFGTTEVAVGMLAAHGSITRPEQPAWLATQLRRTGVGAFAVVVDQRAPSQNLSNVDDEDLTNIVLSGLRYLARHARDRAGAGGPATLRATIWPVGPDVPARLVQHRFHGAKDTLGRRDTTHPPVATSLADIDELAYDGPALVRATHSLTGTLVQAFGHPEPLQTTAEGALRRKYWGRSREILTWAADSGVEIVDTLAG